MQHHVISCGIAIGSSATNSRSRSRKSSPPRDLPGSELTSNV